MSDITVDWESIGAEVAEQAAAWPELYIPRLGGTAGDTVDLAPLWGRAVAARTAPGELGPEPSVDLLAEEAGGLALRLRAGLTSLANRRDGSVYFAEEIHGPVDQEAVERTADGAITVTMWSQGGNWSDRAWWGRTQAFVYFDDYGEVKMLTPEAELVVATGDTRNFPRGANPFGNSTRFVDSAPRSCVVGGTIAAAYRAWLARGVLRGLIHDQQPNSDNVPITAEGFLRTLQPSA